MKQLTLFEIAVEIDPDDLQPADVSLEAMLVEWDVTGPDEHGFFTFVRRNPEPFSAAWYAEQVQ